MFPPKKILFPVDFSERCTAAARMAETFAGHFESELTLLHVQEPFTYNDVPFDPTPLSKQQLGGYLADELKHFDVQRVLLHGDPAIKIAEYAHSNRFDLIMLPTHGYGRFRRLILGSVTAKVLHDAQCPVWTGVHMEHVPRLEDIAFRKVVCAVDLGKQSCAALRWANLFAAEMDAELSIVHAIPEAKDMGVLYGDTAMRDRLVQVATEKVEGLQSGFGRPASISVMTDDVAVVVCGWTAHQKADLLVIGRSQEDGMLGRLRTNAYSIIRQSPCPVVSV